RVTSPRHLGIRGHSNGGLLVGVALNQKPQLFRAALLENPVLDLLDAEAINNGVKVRASLRPEAMAEYGSPNIPAERDFLESTSPYQNLMKAEGFPKPLIVTSTTDAGVPPSMARKYAARLEMLRMPFWFYESPEGGHGAWVTTEQHAR